MATDGAITAYAESRNLAVEEGAEVRALTPALLGGSVSSLVEGELAPGLRGKLFEHAGRRETAIVLTEVQETVAFIPALVCRDRMAMGDGDPAQLPAESWTATELESAAFNRRYHLLTLAGQDPGLV